MSDKFEYGDLYKFVTSAGIALIAGAFLIPWAFLKENFDLITPAETLKLLPPESLAILQLRRRLLLVIFTHLPALFTSLLFTGAVVFVIGCVLWWRRQTWRDRAEDAATKKAEQELQPMTTAQVEAKAEVEVVSSTNADQPNAPLEFNHGFVLPANRSSAIVSYLDMERRVRERLESCFGSTHYVLSQQRLGAAEFDFILQNHDSRLSDVVIELKVRTRVAVDLKWWVENVRRTAVIAQAYTSATNKRVLPVLLVIVLGDKELSSTLRQSTLAQIALTDISLKGVELAISSEEDFFAQHCGELRQFFSVHRRTYPPLDK